MNTHYIKTMFVLVCLSAFGAVVGCGEAEFWTTDENSTDGTSWEQAIKEVDSEPNETGSEGTEQSKATAGELISATVGFHFNGRADDLEFAIECDAESSVFDATFQACESKLLEIEYSGKTPQFMFVKALGGVVNEKGAGDNWTYRINGKFGKFGCGLAKVENGDRITWTFGKYEPEK